MASLIELRQATTQVLEAMAQAWQGIPNREVQTIFDRDKDHYQVAELGWDGERRIYGVICHLDIREGKVWIQHNQTDESIAELLLERGLQKSDIVLGLQPPYKRPYTGYASE